MNAAWRAVTGQPAPSARRLDVSVVEASAEKGEGDACDLAVTDNIDDTWNSGQHSGWIDLDLGAPTRLSHVRLLPYQMPAQAMTRHRVLLSDDRKDWKLGAEVNGSTQHHRWIEDVAIATGQDAARYVRIETPDHPGWVAWSGIQVFGQQANNS